MWHPICDPDLYRFFWNTEKWLRLLLEDYLFLPRTNIWELYKITKFYTDIITERTCKYFNGYDLFIIARLLTLIGRDYEKTISIVDISLANSSIVLVYLFLPHFSVGNWKSMTRATEILPLRYVFMREYLYLCLDLCVFTIIAQTESNLF